MFLLPPSTFEVFIEVNISNLCFLFLVTEMEYKKAIFVKKSIQCTKYVLCFFYIYHNVHLLRDQST